MRNLTALALAAALLALAPDDAAAQADASPVVVELFTSQGCSSCPPADALLQELAGRDDVIALGHHVDYWDYIGWQDPFARPESTERQRGYSRALGLSFIYTPQMVIDGRHDVVGSRRSEVRATIDSFAAEKKPAQVRIDAARGVIVVEAGAAPEEPCIVWLASFDSAHETAVQRGENSGRKLVDANVVRNFEKIGTYLGPRLEIEVDLAAAKAAGRGGVAVLIQHSTNGPILGAAKLDF
ncbi:MAG: DUF1223 domain-containing protein [Rhodovibrionaceae bacterium]